MEPCANKSACHDKKKFHAYQKLQSILADVRELIIKLLQPRKQTHNDCYAQCHSRAGEGFFLRRSQCLPQPITGGRACCTEAPTFAQQWTLPFIITQHTTCSEKHESTPVSMHFLTIIRSSTRWQHIGSYRRQQSDIVAALHRAATQWRKPVDKTILASSLHIVLVSTCWSSCPMVNGVAILRGDLTCWSTRWRQH